MDEQLSPEEEEEAQRLYAELCEDIARGDTWGLKTTPLCPCGGVLYLERSKWRCRHCGRFPEACCNGSRG